ncbi:Hypothetical protein ABZS17D1_04295 (plasmid) [Kosakonia cowanii]
MQKTVQLLPWMMVSCRLNLAENRSARQTPTFQHHLIMKR